MNPGPITTALLDFGSWLAEELGHPLTPVDVESCLDDWLTHREQEAATR